MAAILFMSRDDNGVEPIKYTNYQRFLADSIERKDVPFEDLAREIDKEAKESPKVGRRLRALLEEIYERRQEATVSYETVEESQAEEVNHNNVMNDHQAEVKHPIAKPIEAVQLPLPIVDTDSALFTTEEFARLLKVSRTTVWRWVKADKIRAIRVGRQYRIPRAELERVIGSGL